MGFRSEQGTGNEFADTLVFGRAVGSMGSLGAHSMNGDQMVDRQMDYVEGVNGAHGQGHTYMEADLDSERA